MAASGTLIEMTAECCRTQCSMARNTLSCCQPRCGRFRSMKPLPAQRMMSATSRVGRFISSSLAANVPSLERCGSSSDYPGGWQPIANGDGKDAST
jgi:hypothetical protein